MSRSLYHYNSIDALKEANEIFAANNLTEDEYNLVKDAVEHLKNCKGCQFDCVTNGCTW